MGGWRCRGELFRIRKGQDSAEIRPKIDPKRGQKNDRIWDRLFARLGSILGTYLGPFGEPRRLGIRQNAQAKLRRNDPREAPNTILLFNTVGGSLGIDFLGGQGSKFGDFWKIFRASWRTLAILLGCSGLTGDTSPRPAHLNSPRYFPTVPLPTTLT